MFRALITTCFVAVLPLTLAAGCNKDERAKIAAGAQQMGEGIAEGAKSAWDSTKEGARLVGEKLSADATAVRKGASDAWITTKLKAKIGVTQLFGVSVTTENRKVRLTGKVKTPEEKAAIERLAKDTEGVASVESHLVVEGAPAP